MRPWSKCQYYDQGNIGEIKLSRTFSHHDVCIVGRCNGMVPQGNSEKSPGMSQKFIHTHGLRSP